MSLMASERQEWLRVSQGNWEGYLSETMVYVDGSYEAFFQRDRSRKGEGSGLVGCGKLTPEEIKGLNDTIEKVRHQKNGPAHPMVGKGNNPPTVTIHRAGQNESLTDAGAEMIAAAIAKVTREDRHPTFSVQISEWSRERILRWQVFNDGGYSHSVTDKSQTNSKELSHDSGRVCREEFRQLREWAAQVGPKLKKIGCPKREGDAYTEFSFTTGKEQYSFTCGGRPAELPKEFSDAMATLQNLSYTKY